MAEKTENQDSRSKAADSTFTVAARFCGTTPPLAAVDHGRKSNALSVRVLSFEGVALDNRVTEVRG